MNVKQAKVKIAFQDATKSLKRLEEALNMKIQKDAKIDLVIKRFEFTYETFWKFFKKFLDCTGVDTLFPRDVFEECYKRNLIRSEEIWLEMMDNRNISAHEYNMNKIKEIYPKIKTYAQTIKEDRKNFIKLVKNV